MQGRNDAFHVRHGMLSPMVSLRTRLAVVAAALLLVSGTCRPRVDAPAPTLAPESEPEIPPSRIDTFVRIPLSAIASEADEVVPRRFRVEPYRMVVEGTPDDPVVTAGYDVERERLSIDADHGRLVLRTSLAYSVRARRHVGPIEVPGSCGVDEARRHFRLGVAIDARIAPTLDLVPTLRVVELEAVDRCEMTFAGVDVTGRVRRSLLDELEAEIPGLALRITRSVALHQQVERAWHDLAEPIALDDGTYLAFAPEALAITQPTIEGHYLRVGIAIRARPEVHVGGRPSRSDLPLPEAEAEVGVPRIDLHVPTHVSYTVLERSLRDEFRLDHGGIRYPATGRRFVRPTDVTLYGYGRPIVVRVEFTGFADGVLYLTGTPTLDPETQVVTFPDLEFTLETRRLLLRAASFLRADDIRADLRERIRLDLRSELDATRIRLSQALRREVGGFELNGAIDSMQVTSLRADPESRTIRALVRASGVVSAHRVGD